MIERDSRYDFVKILIETGKITTIQDFFKYVPKTIVAKDLGKKIDRFTILINKVEGFTFDEVYRLAKIFEVEEIEMVKLIHEEHVKNKNKIKSIKPS